MSSGFVGQVEVSRLKAKELAGSDGILQVLTNLGVSGSAQFNDLTTTSHTCSGGIQGASLNISGNSTFNALSSASLSTGTITASGSTNLQALDAQATSVASLTSAGAVQANGTLDVVGQTTLDALTAGATNLGQTAVSGGLSADNMTASGTLGVSGATTLASVSATSATLGQTAVSGGLSTDTLTATGASTLDAVSATTINTSGQVVVGGDLVVNGTTTTINSTEKTIVDPQIALGDSTNASVKDTGIKMLHNDGSAKVAFMGLDVSENKFTMIADATDTNEVMTGSPADLKVGQVECSGITLGGDIGCVNLVVSGTSTQQDVDAQAITAVSLVCSADISGVNVSGSTKVSAPTAEVEILTAQGASIAVSKDMALGAQSLSATNAVLTGDLSAVNVNASTKVVAPTLEGDNLTATGSQININKPVVSTDSVSATAVSGTTASFSTSVATPLLKGDTLDASTAGSIAVAKPLAMGANGISGTGAITGGSATISGVVKAGTLKAPQLGTDASEIAVQKPMNLGLNDLTTTGALNGATGVFSTSVSTPALTSAGTEIAVQKDLNAGAFTIKNNTAQLRNDGYIEGTSLSITGNGSISTGGAGVFSTSITTALLTSAGTEIALGKDLNCGAFALNGTGDWLTTGKITCGDLEITNVDADAVIATSAEVDSLVISGSAFTPATQTITDLTTKDITSSADNIINVGTAGDAITIAGSTVEITGTLTNNGSPISGGGTTYDATTDITAQNATFASVNIGNGKLRFDDGANRWYADSTEGFLIQGALDATGGLYDNGTRITNQTEYGATTDIVAKDATFASVNIGNGKLRFDDGANRWYADSTEGFLIQGALDATGGVFDNGTRITNQTEYDAATNITAQNATFNSVNSAGGLAMGDGLWRYDNTASRWYSDAGEGLLVQGSLTTTELNIGNGKLRFDDGANRWYGDGTEGFLVQGALDATGAVSGASGSFTGICSAGYFQTTGQVIGHSLEISGDGSDPLTAYIHFKTPANQDADAEIRLNSAGTGLEFKTGGEGNMNPALTLDASQNASFGGNVGCNQLGATDITATGSTILNGLSVSATAYTAGIFSTGMVYASGGLRVENADNSTLPDHNDEKGRLYFNTDTNKLYVCRANTINPSYAGEGEWAEVGLV